MEGDKGPLSIVNMLTEIQPYNLEAPEETSVVNKL